jgi:hypothetical protein
MQIKLLIFSAISLISFGGIALTYYLSHLPKLEDYSIKNRMTKVYILENQNNPYRCTSRTCNKCRESNNDAPLCRTLEQSLTAGICAGDSACCEYSYHTCYKKCARTRREPYECGTSYNTEKKKTCYKTIIIGYYDCDPYKCNPYCLPHNSISSMYCNVNLETCYSPKQIIKYEYRDNDLAQYDECIMNEQDPCDKFKYHTFTRSESCGYYQSSSCLKTFFGDKFPNNTYDGYYHSDRKNEINYGKIPDYSMDAGDIAGISILSTIGSVFLIITIFIFFQKNNEVNAE